MPWYVAWASTPWNGLLRVFIAPPHTIIAAGQEAAAFCRRAHRTVHCTTDKHYSVPCHVIQPLGSIAVDRWIRPLPRLSGAVLQREGAWLRAPLRKLSGCPAGQFGAHQTGTVHCSVHHQCAGWLPSTWISLVISFGFFFLSLGLLSFFMSSFEVLHPQCLSPILFTSYELQT
jgi:hypothetical protein